MTKAPKPPPGNDAGDGEQDAPFLTLGRRGFLKLTAISTAAGSLPVAMGGCKPGGGGGTPTLTLRVRRADDMFVGELEFFNLIRPVNDRGVLQRFDVNADAFIALILPPQHILERAVADKCDPPPLPLESYLSGPSRLVFKVPEDAEPIPYDLDAILDAVTGFELSVVAAAAPSGGPNVELVPGNVVTGVAQAPSEGQRDVAQRDADPAPPARMTAVQSRVADADSALRATQERLAPAETVQRDAAVAANPGPGPLPPIDVADDIAIAPAPVVPAPEKPGATATSLELPTRLILSPSRLGRFRHAASPVVSQAGRVELWHSRLSGSDSRRRVRAVWNRDRDELNVDIANIPFPASLTPDMRNQIVSQSADAALLAPGEPIAVDTDRLFASALGGYLDARGDWPVRAGLNLTHWSHRAALGRDHFVRVAYEGVLFPWGHRASLVVISERKIEPPPQIAYLRQRYFLIIKEPNRNYFNGFGSAEAGPLLRQLPLQNMEITQLVTPSLDPPLPGGCNSNDEFNQPFVPRVDGKSFRFPYVATDRQGNVLRSEAAVVWVPVGGALPTAGDLHEDHFVQLDGAGVGNDRMDMAGQRVGMVSGAGDGSTYEAHEFVIRGGDFNQPGLGYGVPWLPYVQQATLTVEAARGIQGDGRVDVGFYPTYVSSGFDNNDGEVFLQLADELGLDFTSNTDKSGGFVSPNMGISGLSRSRGSVPGDIDNFATGNVDNPAEMFGNLLPKLFGTIPLDAILNLGNLDDAPSLIADVADAVRGFVGDLARMESAAQQVAGQIGQVPSELQDVLDAVGDVIDAITTPPMDLDIADPGSVQTYKDQLADSLAAFGAQVEELEQALLALPGVTPNARRLARETTSRVRRALEKVERIEQFVDRVFDVYENVQLALAGTIRLEFNPPLKGDPAGIFNPTGGLVLGAEIRARAVDGRPAGADLFCGLEDFQIKLIGGDDPPFTIDFERLQFIVRAGSKPDVDVVLNEIRFGGPLSFIERIKSLIPLDGFSDPPAVDISAQGLDATFSLPLPNIAVGVFSLENMSISAGFRIPFLGDAITVRFGFCSRENPFRLTVSMLGGGGFVGLELAPGSNGLRLLEVSLEFGASLSVDFGVASGGVSIMAGVYFAIEQQDVFLSGYVRIRGEVCVLGLIGASIELAMELSYRKSEGKAVGKASLKIEITIFAFSIGVTLEVERKFKGSNGDPTFAELMAPVSAVDPADGSDQGGTPWAEYVNAFA